MGLVDTPKGTPFEEFRFKTLEQAFRNAWTDNADILSLCYTGTPALKTDFTRTGKRSTMGAVNDGKHSVIRYYINNFNDGFNNDCLDLSQGHITAQQKLNSRPFMSPLKIAFISLLGTLVLTRFFLNETFPYPSENAVVSGIDQDSASFKVWLLHSLVYFGVFVVGMLGIQKNGSSFVDDASRLNL